MRGMFLLYFLQRIAPSLVMFAMPPAKELEEWLRHSPWGTTPKRVMPPEETCSKVTVLKTASLRKL